MNWKEQGDNVIHHIPGITNPSDSLTNALGWVLHHSRHACHLMRHCYGHYFLGAYEPELTLLSFYLLFAYIICFYRRHPTGTSRTLYSDSSLHYSVFVIRHFTADVFLGSGEDVRIPPLFPFPWIPESISSYLIPSSPLAVYQSLRDQRSLTLFHFPFRLLSSSPSLPGL